MGLFKNRLRTITGENTKFWKSVSRLIYYAANKKRIGKLIIKGLPFLNKKLTYEKWLKQNHLINQKTIDNEISSFSIHPTFAIIILGDTLDKIQRTTDSITNQSYLAHILFVANNSIANNLGFNSIDLEKPLVNSFTKNEFVLFLDSGDLLVDHCLFYIAKEINSSKNVKCIYFDEDVISTAGKRNSPNFKPGWSPDLLLNYNYVLHAFFHSTLLTQLICINDSAVDITYQLLISKMLERQEISHIQSVLLSSEESINIFNKSENANPLFITKEPLISIIIPTRNKAQLLKQCLLSIIEISTYSNYEIILIDNRSDEVEMEEMIQLFLKRKDIHIEVVRADIDFNFSSIINLGAKKSKGEYLLFLNNDMQVISPDWMERMVAHAQQIHVGAVGAMLLYPDNSIQHAGIVLENENISKHVFLGKRTDEKIDQLSYTRNYLAITAACLLVDSKKFIAVGGFDPKFKVEFNDIDFCLKLYEKGFYNVFLPDVMLYHYESSTRRHPHSDKKSYKRHKKEVALMRNKWELYISNDPYNTNRY